MPANQIRELNTLLESMLGTLLASLHDLWMLEREVHIQIQGTEFHALHEMFEEFYEDTSEHADELGERIVSRGGSLEITPEKTAAESILSRETPTFRDSNGPLFQVRRAKQELNQLCYELIEEFSDDPVIEDVLIEIAREQEFHLYQLDQTLK